MIEIYATVLAFFQAFAVAAGVLLGISITNMRSHKKLKRTQTQAWQDGHDTALMNGQSENPYEENK